MAATRGNTLLAMHGNKIESKSIKGTKLEKPKVSRVQVLLLLDIHSMNLRKVWPGVSHL